MKKPELFSAPFIIHTMRFLLFALMIALLPLRGWVGDAMATEMTLAQSWQQTTIKGVASNNHGTWINTHFDHKIVILNALHGAKARHEAQMPLPPLAARNCAGHAFAGHGPSASMTCDACVACQACHTAALGPHAARLLDTAFRIRALPGGPTARFASADTARDQKPPIS